MDALCKYAKVLVKKIIVNIFLFICCHSHICLSCFVTFQVSGFCT